MLFGDEVNQDFLTVPKDYPELGLSQGCYSCSGLDGVDAQYRVEDGVIIPVDAGQFSESDDSELMGSAPRFWAIQNGTFHGVIQIDGKNVTLSVEGKRIAVQC